jgi:hypothetical protein
MPAYRLYRVDGAGKILSAEWLEAPNDEAAVEAARAASAGTSCELWQRQRLIARIGRDGSVHRDPG